MLGDDRHTQGEGHVMREAEVGEMKPQPTDAETARKPWGVKRKDSLRTPLRVPGELWSCQPLILDL